MISLPSIIYITVLLNQLQAVGTLTMAKIILPVVAILLVLVVLQPPPATCDLFSPVSQKVCNNVECGKGKCVPSTNSTVLFVCKCDAGWLQSPIDGYTDGNDFLPCVYPNCTMNLSCTQNHSPTAPPQPADADKPVLDPCRWVSCGGGTCKKNSSFMWSCECLPDFYNLNNKTAFPCFKPCALGSQCSNVGATLYNDTSPASLPDGSPSAGAKGVSNAFQLQQHPKLIMLITVLASTTLSITVMA